ncbi:MAG: hypothetical protein ACI83B_002799 [Sediminicola sp.]|jgi:hypothetical protein
MKKLILTLFLASASLVSFAQSTVKTIRVADATTDMTVNLPEGTLVIDVATKDLYVANASVSLIGNAGSEYNLTNGLAALLFVKVNDGSVYAVIGEDVVTSAEVTTGQIDVDVSSPAPDGALVAIANTDFKVYVNGSLLATGDYAYAAGLITITGDIYEFDQVTVVYNTIK